MEQDDGSARGRVRKALTEGLGFRFPKSVAEDEARARLDRICDDLAYLTDENLRRVIGALRTKGDGTAKCFWPGRATFLGYAELAQPRPLEQAPGVASWFASVAGARAAEAGRLVAEWVFWEAHKRPPQKEFEWRRIAEDAADWRRRADRMRGREDLSDDDAQFLRWFEATEARALALVEAGRKGDAA